jgi:multifunctional beta-oxidation protein
MNICYQVNAVFEFDVRNPAGKVQLWSVDLKHGAGKIKLGKAEHPADIVMSIADDDFVQLSTGKLTGQKAFMAGKLKIKGNMMLATKLEPLFKKFSKPVAKL